MILLSLLVSLMLERLRVTPAGWQLNDTARKYDTWLYEHDTFSAARQSEVLGPLLLLIPAFLLAIISFIVFSGFSLFIVNVAVLTLAFHCRQPRAQLKRWYLATERNDDEEQKAARQALLEEESEISLGQQLVWLNFRYYFAVIVWFALLGAPGVVAYITLRANEEKIPQLMGWIDWLPVRIAGATFLLVGNFTRSMNAWLASLDSTEGSKDVLLKMADVAEEFPGNDDDETAEPQAMLGLARRATISLLVLVSLASMLGWLG